MSSLSPEASYHSIPEAPVGSGVIDFDNDESAGISNAYLNSRLRWIHFLLGEPQFSSSRVSPYIGQLVGCALLLPWNGQT